MNRSGNAAMIPITKTQLGEDERTALDRVLTSGWVMQGPEVAAFEAEVAAFVGAAGGAVAVSSGTAALHLGMLALGIGPGDEVITVSHSFIATANAVRLCGATPVFVDIEAAMLNLDARQLEAAVTAKTRAILCAHQLGMPCDLDAIAAFAAARGLFVIEDAACALGSRWRGVPVGAPHGALATFSFHPRKLVTTGDGGLVTARDPAVLARVRRLRQHGSLDGATFDVVGYNYRMTDLQAAVGRVQLGRLPSLLTERAAQVARYVERLASVAGVVVPTVPRDRDTNWQSFAVRLPGRDARTIVKQLNQNGIGARAGITNAHEQPAYADQPRRASLPESERASREIVMLPLFPGLTEIDQERVIEALRSCI